VYMRLFLRSYAQFIGADTEQALDDYELHTTGKVSAKLENAPESTLENPKEGPSIIGNSPIPPKQIITGIAVIVGLFLFFKLVSGLSEQQVEAETQVKVEAKVEDVPKIESISGKPETVEIELTTPAETTEIPTEDVKKKP